MVGDVAAGAHYTTPLVPCWNALIALVTYLVLVWLLSSVVSQQREMEARIRQRTAALTDEIAERERLEKVILEIGEKERSSIGRDLHDDLGQHLTGTALAGQVLGEKLQARKAEEEGDVWRIVRLIEEGIEKTRRLARGLLLAEIERNGLRAALQEFAGTTAEQFRVGCSFQCEEGVDCLEIGTATHLFRITQEAVRNAVRHGNATRIAIVLDLVDGCLVLAVQDNGKGLPPPDRRGQGLGLRIMAHRAAMIHAHFKVEAMTAGGTVVQCRLPVDATQSNAQG
jgi:signal transduction histidine kinase